MGARMVHVLEGIHKAMEGLARDDKIELNVRTTVQHIESS